MWCVVLRASMAFLAEVSELLSSAMVMMLLVWWVGRDDRVLDVSADGLRTPAMIVVF